ncbi:ParB/RepB/Spo0J family partition protein [Deinococcus roseus]|uniref:Chromosome 1-partitioning protein ParB n=1 Tax=Deinococcus roseus TaxID=392414 RepID=A0ABQ2D0C6_9DEIO|nr:ParB/RepB/Spo0J family partition protein [Deinococcus roseus]GGJ38433.1 putative chromosome 1-partitioning protein ParB [Deinococcus roseus]
MSKRSNLGRGLDALLGKSPLNTAATAEKGEKLLQLPLDQIQQAAYQPRQVFDPEALSELAASIKEKGVLQPILVRQQGDKYELIAGERRWRAARLAGLTEVPVILKNFNDLEALEIAIIENLQREDLNPVEEAVAYQKLLEQGLSQEGIARALGKGRSTVANALRLLTLPQKALDALEQKQITAGHARAILALPEDDRLWALGQILSRGLNVRDAEALKRERPEKASTAKALEERTFKSIELELARHIGTKVRIAGKEKGKIELSYHSQEELERLLELLGYQT